LAIKTDGLIVPIPIGNNNRAVAIKNELMKYGYAVGAIRQPTVPSAIIRLIARLGQSSEELRMVCKKVLEIR